MAFGLLGGVTDAAVSAANSVASGSGGGWFQDIGKYATKAFDWLEQNPNTANVLGGVAAGIGTAYLQSKAREDEQDFEREMYGRRRRDEMINPGEIDSYGTHINSLSRGLLSHGMITGREV
ncbi:hypothetical protein ACFQH5_20185 [Halomonas salifodinae]|uniref:DUF637 domain-containing protein n=1 Tax=Halomonas salifodinae TaxID=438745 RepID=A0ABW2F1D6_9GAMM